MTSYADSTRKRLNRHRALHARGAEQLELELCRRDVVHWVNAWAWTYDPQREPSALPFDLFPKQEEFLKWLADREKHQESGIVEKSREVGVTFLCCVYALHRWLFRPGCQICFASRKLEYVDRRGDPKCIFEKIRFILYHLPTWMLPAGFSRKTHDHEAKLVNPANGSTITGEGGDEIGRGGRATIYFVDEAAHLARPEQADSALSQTTRVRIDVSTPNGPGNPFYRKRFSGKLPVFRLHWRDDARKDEAWYEREKERLIDPVIIATQLDIDYAASLEGICIPAAWVIKAVELDLPPSGPTVAGLDVAEEGPAKTIFLSRRGPLIDTPRSFNGDTTQTAQFAARCAAEVQATLVCYDGDGLGAGVRAAFKHMRPPPQFHVRPVHGGGSGTDARWPDGRSGRERFRNLRAELWWMLRTRFERTFAHVTRGERHQPEEMISIPDHAQLIADLSLPTYHFTDTGKVQIESKVDMKRRGVRSPDFADALAYSFAPGGPQPGGYAKGGEMLPCEPSSPRPGPFRGFAGG